MVRTQALRRRSAPLLCLVLLLAAIAPAAAQRPTCEQIARMSNPTEQVRALEQVSFSCPDNIQILANALSAIGRYSSDPADVWSFVLTMSFGIDKRIFEQALSAAADRRLVTIHRAAAMLIVGAQTGKTLEYYSHEGEILPGPTLLTVPLDSMSLCATALQVSHGPWRGPQPLPSDYRRRAAKVLDPIAVDSTEPQVLRRLAECTRPDRYNDELPPQIDVSGVRLIYVCANRFRVVDPTPRWLPFRRSAANRGEGLKAIYAT